MDCASNLCDASHFFNCLATCATIWYACVSNLIPLQFGHQLGDLFHFVNNLLTIYLTSFNTVSGSQSIRIMAESFLPKSLTELRATLRLNTITYRNNNIEVVEGYFIQTFSLLRYDCKFCNCTFFLKFTFGINITNVASNNRFVLEFRLFLTPLSKV